MNAPVHPELLRRLDATPPPEAAPAREGALRLLWQSRFGPMLIEVVDGVVQVNGEPVEPARLDTHRTA